MSRLQSFLLRWIASDAIYNCGAHRMFEIIAREAEKVWHEDNMATIEDWAHERMAVGFHNARIPHSSRIPKR